LQREKLCSPRRRPSSSIGSRFAARPRILLFDPVHCYGLPGYLEIIEVLEARGWPRTAFWPHGGHLFCLHVAAALGLGGAEVNPLCFQPFGGYGDDMRVVVGATEPPTVPGIGFELKRSLRHTFEALLGDEASGRL
jgi:L-alanine-DL-glutamate epimerase-like enolase superfamily enzyme